MSLRFDGRAVAITGAGRGIGRAYALLLAELGASVVVNDLGGSRTGTGGDPGPANEVVEQIRAEGGTAVADASDVSTPEGGAAIVEAAIREFGRIDSVINNAGNVIWAGLPDLDVNTLESILAVHTKGSFNTVRAAWPHMVKQGFGRIVLTTSVGLFGMPDNLPYATAKASMIGMAKALTAAGADHGIKANCIAPNAMTRMAGTSEQASAKGFKPIPSLEPEVVAPLAAYLSHEQCTASGEVYAAGGGRYGRLFLAETPGYLAKDTSAVSVDEIAENWDEINAEAGYFTPVSPMDWSARFMAHLFGPS